MVKQANAAGMYVILDLHWAAPGTSCPMLQTQMADTDHSLDFWTSIAQAYQSNPTVMFELFNEPFMNVDFTGDQWAYLMYGTGGSFSGYPRPARKATRRTSRRPWSIASYQAIINAVRSTGATNPVLIGSLSYTADLSGWLAHVPSDPLNQMAATWHPYPGYGQPFGSAAYSQPGFAPQVFNEVKAIFAAGIPVIATETGDQDTAGTVRRSVGSNHQRLRRPDEHVAARLDLGRMEQPQRRADQRRKRHAHRRLRPVLQELDGQPSVGRVADARATERITAPNNSVSAK